MQSPPLQLMPVSTTHYYVSGDVTIHPGAAIAPGVLLQADPGCRIVIHASVCVGLGSLIHAHSGTIEVGEGVIVGAGVLLIGNLIVGDRACVGSGTTAINRSIERMSIVPPGSLMIFEQSDSVEEPIEEVFEPGFCPPSPEQNGSEPAEENAQRAEAVSQAEVSQNNGAKPKTEFSQANGARPPVEPQESDEIESPASQENSSDLQRNGEVYGQAYVSRLLGKLFPEQRLSDSNGQSPQ